MDRLFVEYAVRKLRQLGGRIEDCLGRLNEDQIWARGGPNENAVGNLVLHLSGNLRQWIIAAIGGQAEIRERDAEFAARGGYPASALIEKLRGTLAEANGIIENVSAQRLAEPLMVQSYRLTVLEAIFHVVEHFAGHTGQIIYATKLAIGEDLAYYRHLRSSAAHTDQTP